MIEFKLEDPSFFAEMYYEEEKESLSTPFKCNTNELKIHELANINHPITGHIYESMVNSIKKNGILKPIVLWEGRVVDGRHRLKIAKQLKLKTVACQNYEGSEHDLHEYLIALERHRHSNTAQLAITAVFNHVQTGNSVKDAIANSGVSKMSFYRAQFIAFNDVEITKSLRKGDSVPIVKNGIEVFTSSLVDIEKYIKNNMEFEAMTKDEIDEMETRETSEIAKDAKIILDLIHKSDDKAYVDRLKMFIIDSISPNG